MNATLCKYVSLHIRCNISWISWIHLAFPLLAQSREAWKLGCLLIRGSDASWTMQWDLQTEPNTSTKLTRRHTEKAWRILKWSWQFDGEIMVCTYSAYDDMYMYIYICTTHLKNYNYTSPNINLLRDLPYAHHSKSHTHSRCLHSCTPQALYK